VIRKRAAFRVGSAAGTTLSEGSVALADGRVVLGPFLDAPKTGRVGCDHGPGGDRWGSGTGRSRQSWRGRVTGDLVERLSVRMIQGVPFVEVLTTIGSSVSLF
jgi:hypothetical protein